MSSPNKPNKRRKKFLSPDEQHLKDLKEEVKLLTEELEDDTELYDQLRSKHKLVEDNINKAKEFIY